MISSIVMTITNYIIKLNEEIQNYPERVTGCLITKLLSKYILFAGVYDVGFLNLGILSS
jgi:hypothetical protein